MPPPPDDGADPVVVCGAWDDAVVSVEATDVPTVPRVTWSTDAPGTTWVEFTAVGDPTYTTPIREGEAGEHEALLLGLPASSEVTFRVMAKDESGSRCSAIRSTTTGGLDAGLPELVATTFLPEELEDGYLVAPILRADGVSLAIVDTAGRYVWAQTVSSFSTVLRVRRSMDGESIVYHKGANPENTVGVLVRNGMDGVERAQVPVVDSHTDFAELAEGQYATLVYDVRTVEGRRIVGDKIVEVDESGALREIWSTFDDFAPDLSETFLTNRYPAEPEAEDWTHANSLSYDAGSDTLTVVLGHLHTVVRVDRVTGDLVDAVGQEGTYTSAPDLLSSPHSAVSLADDTLLVFNRNTRGEACSESIEIAIDGTTATEVSSYQSETCLNVYYLGQALRLAGGNTLTVFTTSGQVDQSTPDGETAWRLSLDLGAGIGFSEYATSLY